MNQEDKLLQAARTLKFINPDDTFMDYYRDVVFNEHSEKELIKRGIILINLIDTASLVKIEKEYVLETNHILHQLQNDTIND